MVADNLAQAQDMTDNAVRFIKTTAMLPTPSRISKRRHLFSCSGVSQEDGVEGSMLTVEQCEVVHEMTEELLLRVATEGCSLFPFFHNQPPNRG